MIPVQVVGAGSFALVSTSLRPPRGQCRVKLTKNECYAPSRPPNRESKRVVEELYSTLGPYAHTICQTFIGTLTPCETHKIFHS